MSTVSMSGAGLSAQVMMAMDQLSREMRTSHREASFREADRALEEGLKEADEMHEKADATLNGAIVSGGITALSGGIQVYAAASMKVTPESEMKPPAALDDQGNSVQMSVAEQQKAVELHIAPTQQLNSKMQAISQAASSLGQMGGIAQNVASSSGDHHEANARAHSARSQAASRRADAEMSAAQDAQKSGEKARDTYQQILSLDHASRMAVLRG